MESKYFIFLIGSTLCVPSGIVLARTSPLVLNLVFFALIFGTTQVNNLFGLPTDINFLSREWYRGTTRGIEITYLDLLAIILLFGSLHARRLQRIPFPRTPSLGLMTAFFAWAAFNVVVTSDPKIFGTFELTKIARGILLFTAVAAYVRSPREVKLFLCALIFVVCYEGAVALQDRYIFGEHRVRGTFPHPNILSMYGLQCFPVLLSAWFARDIPLSLRNVSALAGLVAAGTTILSISRTGYAAMLILAVGVAILNTGFRLKPRNIGLAILVILAFSGMLIKSWEAVDSRFESFDLQEEYVGEEAGRGAYFSKGLPAIIDHPLTGVGLNNWSYWISNRYASEAGYESEPYPNTHSPPANKGQEAPAHSLYLITIGELGLPGLVLLLALFGRWLYISGSGLLSVGDTLVERVRLGAFLSLCGILMQSVTEWEFRETHLFFLGHIIMAVAAVIYQNTRQKPQGASG